jgi:type I restriction enzyme R subunit
MADQMSNFTFLSQSWDFLSDDANKAERYSFPDPRAASIYARRALELALKWLFQNDSSLKLPYETNLASMIHEPTFASNIKRGLLVDIKSIHRLGNVAAHEQTPISPKEGIQIVAALHRFLGWLARVYTRGGAEPGQFNPSLLPKAEAKAALSVDEAQSLLGQLQERETAAVETEQELAALRQKVAELQAIKDANLETIGADEYTEAETRDQIIDIMLREAGWDPKAQNVEEYPVQGMPTSSGQRGGDGFVDYVLWGKDGKPVALVEAKRTKVDPEKGQRQAELYADCLEQMHGQRPLIYYSNGYTTWFWDDQLYAPREVAGFATLDECQWRINQRSERKDLTMLQPNPEITDRLYQHEAAARVMEAFGSQHRQRALIAMATGSGKTRLAISLVDMLLKGNWVRRVLFLADRIALVNQAKREFKKHLPNVSVASLLDPKEGDDARVVFSTYPTMMNCIDGTRKDKKGRFSSAHFDLIIVDEAHRSVYQKFGAIFEWFDSLLLGLTATPRGEVDRNTYRLFHLDDYQPTFSYELEQAVADGFLVPPKALSVPVMFVREGIKYDELTFEEQEEYEEQESFWDQETGALIKEIYPSALNQWLFNTDTVDQVLRHVMEHGLKVDGGDTLGKTIIFAKNTRHADFIVKRFDKNYPELKGKFCRQIDYSVKYAQSLIDDFSLVKKWPQIAVSVDMLDTGIDVPEIVNLVFFKLIRSKVKFWQMIGRGTRLREDLYGPGSDKEFFFVFDYCQNLEFFAANPDPYEGKAQKSLKQQIFNQRVLLKQAIAANTSSDESLNEFSREVTDALHGVVENLNTENFIIRRELEHVTPFLERKRWDTLNDKDVSVLCGKISGLPVADDDEETARRFDLLILNLQHALLEQSKTQLTFIKSLYTLAGALEEKQAIPSVGAKMALILEVQTEDFWNGVTLPILENVRRKLRGLIQFIDSKAAREEVYTHFEDMLLDKDTVEFDLIAADPRLQNYRVRAQRIIRENLDHITIRRLKTNQPISSKDIESLEQLLFAGEEGISREEFEQNVGADVSLGEFVRRITGLERKAAKDAFSELLIDAGLTGDQLAFVDEIINHLVHNGILEPGALFETPFTNLHTQGVVGIFPERAAEIVYILKGVNSRVYAA